MATCKYLWTSRSPSLCIQLGHLLFLFHEPSCMHLKKSYVFSFGLEKNPPQLSSPITLFSSITCNYSWAFSYPSPHVQILFFFFSIYISMCRTEQPWDCKHTGGHELVYSKWLYGFMAHLRQGQWDLKKSITQPHISKYITYLVVGLVIMWLEKSQKYWYQL